MKIIYNILLSLVSISVQQSSAYYSSAAICSKSTNPNNCSSPNNIQNGVLCCTLYNGNITSSCISTSTIGGLLVVMATSNNAQC